ncbi:hypothetical protein [Amycolatopsis sp. NPDC059657]|uniref:hypothetical protein n=1 Tax=Amycolatopsis sp. NPDC059657 TaxID=3346899 RepID=UPI0036700971
MTNRTLRLLGAGALVFAGVAVAAPSVATAAPTGCSSQYIDNATGGQAYCTSGTGTFRIRIDCRKPGQSTTYPRTGIWAHPGLMKSTIWCYEGDTAVRKDINYNT